MFKINDCLTTEEKAVMYGASNGMKFNVAETNHMLQKARQLVLIKSELMKGCIKGPVYPGNYVRPEIRKENK